MPTTKSAEKRLRSSVKRRLINRMRKSRVSTGEKHLDACIAAADREGALAALSQCFSLLDRAAKGGTIHRNTADRKKKRLAARVARLTGA